MALDLDGIRTALQEQLAANLERSTTVYARPVAQPAYPSITILPDSSQAYVEYFETFTDTGYATVNLILVLLVNANMPDAQVAVDDYLSTGTGFGSSIAAAVHSDHTLGGVVDQAAVLACSVDDPIDDAPLRATLPVFIKVKKA